MAGTHVAESTAPHAPAAARTRAGETHRAARLPCHAGIHAAMALRPLSAGSQRCSTH